MSEGFVSLAAAVAAQPDLKRRRVKTEVRGASGSGLCRRSHAADAEESRSHQAVGGPRSRAACGAVLVAAVARGGSSAPLGALLGAVQLCDCKSEHNTMQFSLLQQAFVSPCRFF